MHKFVVFLSIVVFLAVGNAFPSAGRQHKTVFVIVDGVTYETVQRLHPENIYGLSSHGSLGPCHVGGDTGTYNETPTISAVGYMSLLTGTWANKHNVWGNSGLDPDYSYWSLFRIAKEQDSPVTTGLFSSWTDNRTVLLGEGKEENKFLKIDYVADGYDLDSVNYPRKHKDLNIFDYDEKVSSEAAKCIRENAPDLSWVYLWYTDDAFHAFGNGSYSDHYVNEADRQIGRVWDAVRYREKNFDEDWLVIITTDHGRTRDGKRHGGQSRSERETWIASNVQFNKHFKTGNAAIVDILPTVCRYMDFKVPDDVAWEEDGVSLIGGIAAADLEYTLYNAYGEDIYRMEDITGESRAVDKDSDDFPTSEELRAESKKYALLKWKCYDKKADLKIYVSPSNSYKRGGKDQWLYYGTVKAADENAVIDLSVMPEAVAGGLSSSFNQKSPDQAFYKIVLVSDSGSLNCWLR